MAEDPRYDHWVDLVAHLVTDPTGCFPHERLLQEVSATFGAVASWNVQDADGSFAFDLSHPLSGWPSRSELAYWAEISLTVHPLLRWYRTTLDPRAFTIDRVPRSVVPQSCFAMVRELTAPVGILHQLSIPYAFSSNGFRSFVVGQNGADFTDADLELARRIQPMLAVVDRQAQILAATPPAMGDAGLTARETAVLELLSQGMTATRIGHTLGISTRTVHTHLAHVYRKLDVTDRVQAVLAHQRLTNQHPAAAAGSTPRPTHVVHTSGQPID